MNIYAATDGPVGTSIEDTSELTLVVSQLHVLGDTRVCVAYLLSGMYARLGVGCDGGPC